jgi:hypothetical protein
MKKNQTARREGALQRLKNSVFFEKNYRATGKSRTQEEWQVRKDREIENLEAKLGIRTRK